MHRPRPAAGGAGSLVPDKARRWVWRCHIDLSTPNPDTLERLLPYLEPYPAAVFHMPKYVPVGIDGRAHIVPPAIDPLAPKNMAFSPEDAVYICEQFGIDVDRPLLCQVSRFDPWKDPLGVIDAYRIVKEEMPDVQLALVGSMATDDPEGWDYFNATVAHADGDPDIHILNNLNNVGAIEVNAFQSHCDVVIQKSTREGFGLTVTEAIWKGRPFIGGDVGGIPLQVSDGETGFLVSSVEECAQRSLEILARSRARQAARARRQGVGPPAVPDAAPAARLARAVRAAGGADRWSGPPLVLVSNRGPVTFGPDGEIRRGTGGLVTALIGLASHRDVTWIASAMTDEDVAVAERNDGKPFPVQAPGGRRVPGQARRLRPRRLRPLLQHHRQPDAVVHPALPVGPLERAGHPPQRDRGVRVRLQRRQRGPGAGGARGDRGRRAAGRDGPRLPPVHAAGADPPRAPGRVPAPLRPHPVEPVGLVARAPDGDPRGDLPRDPVQRHHRLSHPLLPPQLPAVLRGPARLRRRPRGRRRARRRRSRGVGPRLPAADRRRRGPGRRRPATGRASSSRSCCAAAATT